MSYDPTRMCAVYQRQTGESVNECMFLGRGLGLCWDAQEDRRLGQGESQRAVLEDRREAENQRAVP